MCWRCYHSHFTSGKIERLKYSRAKVQGTSPARMWGPVVARGDAGSPSPFYRQGHHPLLLATDELLLQKLRRNCRRATGGSSLWTWLSPCIDSSPPHVSSPFQSMYSERQSMQGWKSLWEIQTWLFPKVIQHNHPQNETLTRPDLQAVTAVNNQEMQRKKLSPFSGNLQGFIAPFTHPTPPFFWLQTSVLSHQARDHLGNEDSFYS